MADSTCKCFVWVQNAKLSHMRLNKNGLKRPQNAHSLAFPHIIGAFSLCEGHFGGEFLLQNLNSKANKCPAILANAMYGFKKQHCLMYLNKKRPQKAWKCPFTSVPHCYRGISLCEDHFGGKFRIQNFNIKRNESLQMLCMDSKKRNCLMYTLTKTASEGLTMPIQ